MIRDRQTVLSDQQAVTAAAASVDYYDLQAARDVGAGEPLVVVFHVDQTFNTLTSLDLQIQQDDNPGFASPTTILTRNVLLAALVAGAYVAYLVPAGVVTERYLRAFYAVQGTAPTQGRISCEILPLSAVPANVAVKVA